MKRYKEKGFLKWILILLVSLVLASYFFNFNVKDAVEDPQTQSNFSYITTSIERLYTNTLKSHVDYLWRDIFIGLIWDSAKKDLEKIKNDEAPSVVEFAPTVILE
jgi:hypothetical protein